VEIINSFIKYDIKNGEHEEICIENELFLSQHTFSLIEIYQNGYIYIFGGKNNSNKSTNNFYIFDIQKEEIKKLNIKGKYLLIF
jgi:hypothetical protein